MVSGFEFRGLGFGYLAQLRDAERGDLVPEEVEVHQGPDAWCGGLEFNRGKYSPGFGRGKYL